MQQTQPLIAPPPPTNPLDINKSSEIILKFPAKGWTIIRLLWRGDVKGADMFFFSPFSCPVSLFCFISRYPKVV